MKKSLVVVAVVLAFGAAHAEDVRFKFTDRGNDTTTTKTDEAKAQDALAPKVIGQATANQGLTQQQLNGSSAVQGVDSLNQLISAQHGSMISVQAKAVKAEATDAPMCSSSDSAALATATQHGVAGNICKEFPTDMRAKVISTANNLDQRLAGANVRQVSDETFIKMVQQTGFFMSNLFGFPSDEGVAKIVALANVHAEDANGPTTNYADCLFSGSVNERIRALQDRILQ